jgi:hypothetical protein
VNRELFEGIGERIRNKRPLDLSYFAEDNSNEEISMLAYLQTLGANIAGTTAEFEDCIRTLAEEKLKKTVPDGSQLSDADFVKFFENKRNKSGV